VLVRYASDIAVSTKEWKANGHPWIFVVSCYDQLRGDRALMKIKVYRSFLIVRKLGVILNTLDNLSLFCLFRNMKVVGRLGKWIIRLAPFKFNVHNRGADNVLADSFSGMLQGHVATDKKVGLLPMTQRFPLVYTSLE
jgi:hypothetical protein